MNEQKIIGINKAYVFFDPENPRSKAEFKEEDINSLKDSIEKDGQLEAVILEKIGNEKYMIIEGHRRFAAIQKSKKVNVINAIVEEKLSKEDRLFKQILIDNHRKNFSSVDRDLAWKKLYDMGKYDVDSFAKKISITKGMSENFLNRMGLGQEFLSKMKNISTSNIDETKHIKDVKLRKKILKYADKEGLTRKDVRKLTNVATKVSEEVIENLTEGKISIDDADNMVGLNEEDQQVALVTTKGLNHHKNQIKSMLKSGKITSSEREMIQQTSNKVNEFQSRFFKLSADLRDMAYALDELSEKDMENMNESMKKILKGCLKELDSKINPAIQKLKDKLGGL